MRSEKSNPRGNLLSRAENLLERRWVGPLVAVVVVLLAFAPALRGAFVYDDIPYIVENSAIQSPSLGSVFAATFPPGRPDTGLYRPALTLSLLADRAIAAALPVTAATVGHLHSLLLHAIVALLLTALLVTLLKVSRLTALLAALLVALHPATTEAVCWISARSELLGAAWGLAGLLLLAARHGAATPWLAAATLVCALLSKESALVWPLLWVATLWTTSEQSGRVLLQRLWPSFAVVGIYLILRATIAGGMSPEVQAFSGVTPETRAAIVGMSWWRYLRLSLLPTGLTVHWPPLPMSIVGWQVALGALTLCSLATAAAALLIARRWVWGLVLAWFGLGLLPVSNTILPIGTIMAERFLYVPLMAVAIAAALTMSPDRRRGGRRAATATVVVLILCAGAGTFTRAQHWRSDISIWAAAEQAYPRDLVAGVAHSFYLVKDGNPRSMHSVELVWPRVRRIVYGMPPGTLPASLMARARWIDDRLAQSPETPHPSS